LTRRSLKAAGLASRGISPDPEKGASYPRPRRPFGAGCRLNDDFGLAFAVRDR
jgi:hypothetical protein